MLKRKPLLLIFCLLITAIILSIPPVLGQDAGRKLEYIPLYKYKDNPEEALRILKENLVNLEIGEDQVTVTVLPLQPNKIAAQGTAAGIDIVKQLMTSIDPPPQAPPPPPAKPQDLIQDFQVKYLKPTDLWLKLDEVMNNFLDFKRFDTGASNNVVYARDDGKSNRINLYIPNFEAVERNFLDRKQGYNGYKVYLRATQNEKVFIDTMIGFIQTIDQPLGDKRYEVIPVCYVETDEMIKQLRAAGYTAIDTSIDIDSNLVNAVKTGISPVIYTSPKISTESVGISTSFSSGGGREIGGNQFKILSYTEPTSTSDINNLIVYGSDEEIASVKKFIEIFDVPARQVLIEAQIIEINIDALSDIGLRSVTGKDDLIGTSAAPAFPGEGSGTTQENTATIITYDDSGISAGEFEATIAALVLQGKASVKARPKVTTVDGRQAIITIVRQVPVIQETINQNQSRFDITFVPVGITLNIKPRIGRGNSEIQMQVNAVVSNVETINNVVTGLNIQAPELNTREVSTIVRIPNHRPLILGGLISTQIEERTYKVPLLGDIPLLGKLFRRTREKEDRNEIIIVITPHIADEVGSRTDQTANPYAMDSPDLTPLDTTIFDQTENDVTPSTYLIKFEDLVGLDPITRMPISFQGDPPPIGSPNDPVFLSAQRIVRKLKIVERLKLKDVVEFPEGYQYEDRELEKLILAETFAIHYLINVNNLTLENLVVGRAITLPFGSLSSPGSINSTAEWKADKINVAYDFDPALNRIRDSVRMSYAEKKN
jgi:Flp pilus assembly secretin CpaC